MRLITSTALLCAALQIFVMPSPSIADDGTSTPCPPADAKDDFTIQLTLQSGKIQAVPNALCIKQRAKLTWAPDNPNWTWFTIFVDDGHSPFDKGKILHGQGNDHDQIKNCSGLKNCSYTYYGLVIIDNIPYMIDPTIIVNPNAITNDKKKKTHKK
jgi:hypothetical protein